MSSLAILGAGEIGAAVAHKAALRARFRSIRLVDADVNAAQGKALDIRQSGPIDRFDTALSGHADTLDAAGADVIVVADTVSQGEWDGEHGLAMMKQLVRSGTAAPIVFAGPKQVWLMETAVREVGLAANRVAGAPASATAAAARALAALEVDGSVKDVSLSLVGRPGSYVIAWSSATAAGASMMDLIPAHRMLALSDRLRTAGPPKPQAIGAAANEIAEGLAFGSARRIAALTVLDEQPGRGRAALLPLTLGRGRVLARHVPALSAQERVAYLNGLEK